MTGVVKTLWFVIDTSGDGASLNDNYFERYFDWETTPSIRFGTGVASAQGYSASVSLHRRDLPYNYISSVEWIKIQTLVYKASFVIKFPIPVESDIRID
ncbi:hypothetical protein [Haloarcula amylolytica]|uniref:hypothetical protein n=1 Tax=Haloarcula amylolytica TaxID=396317 RepID=UPI00126753AA|nr:hypothetical protein [Haloarcula amylolytica]